MQDTTRPPHPFAGDADPERMGHNRAWFNLLRVHRHLHPQVARHLREAGIEDPIWHEIMIDIGRAGEAGRRMHDVEKHLYVPQYSLSRHVSRLVDRGWVSRSAASGKGRGQVLHLTPEGKAVDAEVWPLYEEAIHQVIGTRLSPDEGYQLARLLIRLYD